MTTALMVVDDQMSADELKTLGKLRQQIENARRPNSEKYKLYEGIHKARNLDIAVPPHLADLDVHVGAPGIVVDVLAERIEWDGWTTTGDVQLDKELEDISRDNALDVEQARQAADSLICGVSFVVVGTGNEDAGEPPVLITAESPMNATLLTNPRTRAAVAGLVQVRDEVTQVIVREVMMLPNSTITIDRVDGILGGAQKVSRDDHGLGMVPMVAFPNRERPSDTRGRSEITRPVRYFTEAIGRTLLGMEIHREFFTAPQRYGLGVDPKQFGIDKDTSQGQKILRQWDIAMSRMNFVPRSKDPEAPNPELGQFPSSPPTPYIEQVKHYLQLLSAESSVPWNYWGFATDNPPSADAVRVLESRLVKRAMLRQRMWTRAWRTVALIALLHNNPGFDRSLLSAIGPNWKDPATPTPAAAADATSKLVGAKILPETSKVTLRRAGMSEAEIAEIERERRTSGVKTLVERMLGPEQPPTADDSADDDVDDGDGGSGS